MPGTPTARGYTTLDAADDADIEQVNVSLQDINDDVDTVEDAAAAATAALTTTVSDLDTASEYAFSTWKPLYLRRCYLDTTGAAQALTDGSPNEVGQPLNASAMVHRVAVVLAPSDVTAGTRANQLRIVTDVCPGGTVPTCAYKFSLYPATITKPAAAPPYVSALGTVVAGSAKTSSVFSTTADQQVIGDAFAAPSAGYYVLVAEAQSAPAANATPSVICRLQYRQT